MKHEKLRRGPVLHRVFIIALSVLMTLLLIWFLGFILGDIGRLRGPDYEAIQKKYVDQAFVDEVADLEKEKQALQIEINNQREIQAILRTSTENSQQTMNQLLEMHRLSLEKNIKPTELEQASLAESEAQFLQNQKSFQQANEEIARLSERLRETERQMAALRDQLEEQRKPAREEFDRLRERHSLKVAALKLAFLVPVLLVAAWLALRKRGSPYLPLILALLCAAFWKTGVVMHQHFPREYFKYIAIGAAIAIVLAGLIHLIRIVASPKKDWLLKLYKEAYARQACPVCGFSIQRGPLRHLRGTWRRARGVVPVLQQGETVEESPYTCPSCGTPLYQPCGQCGKIRHALLLYCEHCGAAAEPPLEAK